ncbi:MAG: anti-sigma factor [Lysobacteraceae bacterium]
MNVRDLHEQDFDGQEPPSADLLAGEYVLGVLDAEQRREAQIRIERDPGFARLVADWEHRLSPLVDTGGIADVPAHLWPRIRNRLGWSAVDTPRETVRPSLWQSTGFWRAATGLAAAAALAAIVIGPLGLFRGDDLSGPGPGPIAVEPTPPTPPVEDPSAPKPVTTLAHDDGSPGWLASVDQKKGTVLMVPVPAPADAKGRVPELWLIPPGGTAKSLGIVSIDRSHTVKVPDGLRDALAKGALLAITLEPVGGAPQGVATGPIIAKGNIVIL